jgi:CBS domain containing-hemolysin-like protein
VDAFLEKGVSIAIVVDEFGGTAGSLPLKILSRNCSASLRMNTMSRKIICKKTDDNSFIISGKVEIDHINENFNVQLPQGEYETVAGLISSFTGRIPMSGETIKIENSSFILSDQTKLKLNW